jgi:hypothetical protein
MVFERLRKTLGRISPAVLPLLLIGCGVGAGGDTTPWTLTSPASEYDESLELEVFVGRLGCKELNDIHVDETRDRVVIESAVETISEECAEIQAGDVVVIDPGHDAWTVGTDPCVFVDFGDSIDEARLG